MLLPFRIPRILWSFSFWGIPFLESLFSVTSLFFISSLYVMKAKLVKKAWLILPLSWWGKPRPHSFSTNLVSEPLISSWWTKILYFLNSGTEHLASLPGYFRHRRATDLSVYRNILWFFAWCPQSQEQPSKHIWRKTSWLAYKRSEFLWKIALHGVLLLR